MAISQDIVKKLERITADLGDILLEMHPGTVKERDVFDGAVTSHKHLRKLDTDSLRQLELPLGEANTKEPKPRKDCPRCQGKGKWIDPDDSTQSTRPCNCKDVEGITWPNVKANWEKVLQPVEA